MVRNRAPTITAPIWGTSPSFENCWDKGPATSWRTPMVEFSGKERKNAEESYQSRSWLSRESGRRKGVSGCIWKTRWKRCGGARRWQCRKGTKNYAKWDDGQGVLGVPECQAADLLPCHLSMAVSAGCRIRICCVQVPEPQQDFPPAPPKLIDPYHRATRTRVGLSWRSDDDFQHRLITCLVRRRDVRYRLWTSAYRLSPLGWGTFHRGAA